MRNPRHWWEQLRASLWFVPATIVLSAVALATALIWVDSTFDLRGVARWQLVFGAGADGARGLLSTVAGSMVTVAGVVFSITLVALSLTSSQYTSRVLRNFMSDRINQAVLGVFVGIFAYCLVVLRTIRGGDEGKFVPSLAVTGGLVLAFVGIGFLIYFIHHISISIQASTIVARVARDTIAAVDRLFPVEIGEHDDEAASLPQSISPSEREWIAVPAPATGYIESVDLDKLVELARDQGSIVRMELGVGDFVVECTPLASIAATGHLAEELPAEVEAAYVISRQRTVQQDAGFGIRQIVDIALRALSPGINDSTTAVLCIDYLTAILVRLVNRRIAMPGLLDDGVLRVIVRGPRFENMLDEALDQIRQNAEGNAAILRRLLRSLEIIARQTRNHRRKLALWQHVDSIAAVATRSIVSARDRAGIEEELAHLSEHARQRRGDAEEAEEADDVGDGGEDDR